ncbi:MAG: hypothetical protein AB1304_00390 [Bacteroidota bacterium]
MDKLKELYDKALTHTSVNQLPESINDVILKFLNEELLSAEEIQAYKNYERFRNHLLSEANDDKDFADRIKKLRVIANFTHWKEFLNYSE